jgi:hypothetical protein
MNGLLFLHLFDTWRIGANLLEQNQRTYTYMSPIAYFLPNLIGTWRIGANLLESWDLYLYDICLFSPEWETMC